MATTKITKGTKEKAVKKTVAPAKIKTAGKVTVKKDTASKKGTKTNKKETKAETKPIKKTEVKIELPRTITGLTTDVIDSEGKKIGTITLSETYFGAKVNKQLIAQAVRVYLSNQREGSASTKTRGEVEGSTRKLYKQKGTGRARHGSIRAPIYVGGGIVFGPQPHSFRLDMPQKMKHQALTSALTSQYQNGNVAIVDGLDKLEPKTKVMAGVLAAITNAKSILLVVGQNGQTISRAARNIERVDILPVTQLNTYTVLSHGTIIFTKEAVKTLA